MHFGITAIFFIVQPDRGQLGGIAEMVDRGELQITIADTFPLAQGQQAYLGASKPRRRKDRSDRLVVTDHCGGWTPVGGVQPIAAPRTEATQDDEGR